MQASRVDSNGGVDALLDMASEARQPRRNVAMGHVGGV